MKQYTIPLHNYLKIEKVFWVELGYREGKDQLRLIIGDRRERVISKIDGEYIYLLLSKEKEQEEILDECDDAFVDYIKLDVRMEQGEYVIHLEELLQQLNLSFSHISDVEYDEVLKKEREFPTDELCPYGNRKESSFWMEDEIFSISVRYLKGVCFIGDLVIRHIQRDTLIEDDAYNQMIKNSASKKISMDLDSFMEFAKQTKGMEFLIIEWENGFVSWETMDGEPKWIYKAIFDVDGEKKKVSTNIMTGKNYTEKMVYAFMQCKTYEEFTALNNKKKLLGV